MSGLCTGNFMDEGNLSLSRPTIELGGKVVHVPKQVHIVASSVCVQLVDDGQDGAASNDPDGLGSCFTNISGISFALWPQRLLI